MPALNDLFKGLVASAFDNTLIPDLDVSTPATVERLGDAVYDASTGNSARPVVASADTVVIVRDLSFEEQARLSAAGVGGAASALERRVTTRILLNGLEGELDGLKDGDEVVVAGSRYRIVFSREKSLAGERLLFECVAARL